MTAIAKYIKNSFGVFNDKETQIYAMFKQMQTLAQVSQLTAIYNRVIGEDLYITLKDKLSSAEMMEIIKIVQKLPKQ